MSFTLDFSKNIFIQSMSPIENLKQRGILLAPPLYEANGELYTLQDGSFYAVKN